MKKQTLEQYLLNYTEDHGVKLHMPGHKGIDIYRETGHAAFLEKIADLDITEIPGADDLFHAQGLIRDLMDRYKDLYHVDASYLLVGGSSAGIVSSVLACVPRGGTIISARNAHRSLFNALKLGDITPVFAYPEIMEEAGIAGAVTEEEVVSCLEQHPEASAVLLVSPNYYGVVSDIEAIAKRVHEAGKILIVDQAHGAHLAFFDEIYGEQRSAERCGADIVINSIHKTLAAFTQTSVLNVNGDRVDRLKLEEMMQSVQSSSPSYILMGSMDINASILEEHREKYITEWEEAMDKFYTEAATIENLFILKPTAWLDDTKINVGFPGMPGGKLFKLLREEYKVEPALYTNHTVMCMTGIGTTKKDMDVLLHALKEISKTVDPSKAEPIAHDNTITGVRRPVGKAPSAYEFIPLEDAVGRVAAAPLTPYPPGIPMICPGETIDQDVIDWIKDALAQEREIYGVDEKGLIRVGR